MLAILAMVAVGCARPVPAPSQQGLSPDAPAARGLPPREPAGTPSPLQVRPPFGLYAQSPGIDTLTTLASGALSPDGRYRAAMTAEGPWVARVDGAWLWQIELQVPLPPPTPPVPPGTHPAKPPSPPPAPAKPPVVVGALQWTDAAQLLFQDDTGAWHLADPAGARVTALPPAFKGKEGLQFSPDGRQVLFYAPGKTGRGLWLAAADGSNPKLVGENVTGFWQKPGGNLVVQKPTPGMDPLLNMGLSKQ